MCLGKLFNDVRCRTLLVIGDHESDVIFGRNIACDIDGSNTVICIAVSYSGANSGEWDHQPDKIISSPQELKEYL